MTINLYKDLIRAVDSGGGEYTRRLIGYALRLCGFYDGADTDAVFAAAAARTKSDSYIRETLGRAEWTEERISLTLDCVRLLEEFSTGERVLTNGADEGKTADIHLAVENGAKSARDNVNIRRSHTEGGENGKFTSGFSTVSTELSTGRADAGGAGSYDRPSLECQIILDAAMLCGCGAYAEAEKINNLRGRNSLSITDHALDAGNSGISEPAFYTRQARKIYKELEKNAREYDSILARECRALDDQMDKFELSGVTDEPIYHRLGLIPHAGCFERDGYFVQGGAVVKSRDRYHLIAAEWRDHLGADGYITGSEIVCAVSDGPFGPFRYTNRLVSMRRRGFWDSQAAFEPSLLRIKDLKGDLFLMFYTGVSCADPGMRKIGAASSRRPEGPYMRPDEPLFLGFDVCYSPSPMQDRDGAVMLAYLHDGGRLAVARCPRQGGEYVVLTDDAAPGADLRLPFLCRLDGRYCIIAEDAGGSVCGWSGHGAMLVSDDAVKWKPALYTRVYDLTLMTDDMAVSAADRRTRPFILTEDGAAKALYTTVSIGNRTFLTAQEINER